MYIYLYYTYQSILMTSPSVFLYLVIQTYRCLTPSYAHIWRSLCLSPFYAHIWRSLCLSPFYAHGSFFNFGHFSVPRVDFQENIYFLTNKFVFLLGLGVSSHEKNQCVSVIKFSYFLRMLKTQKYQKCTVLACPQPRPLNFISIIK